LTKEEKSKILLVGGSRAIRIPSRLYYDDAFPLKEEIQIVVRIEGKKLIIENKEKQDE